MKVSVIIITYNQAKFLSAAIESVLSQNFKDSMEVIVVDDGSTDNTNEVIRPYLDRVKRVWTPNGGQVHAFNEGLKWVSGEYIALLEGDDTWAINKLAMCVDRLEREPQTALLQHWLAQTDAKGLHLPGYSYDDYRQYITLDETLNGKIPYTGTSCIVFRRSVLNRFLPLPKDLFYGTDICLRLIAATQNPIANIPVILGTRRHHGNNIFGETLYDNPMKIDSALIFHDRFTRYQIKILENANKEVPLSWYFEQRIEKYKLRFFRERYAGNFFLACKLLIRIIAHSFNFLEGILRASTLSIALLSPFFYLRLRRWYWGRPC